MRSAAAVRINTGVMKRHPSGANRTFGMKAWYANEVPLKSWMQNAECRTKNEEVRPLLHSKFCILHSAFCVLHSNEKGFARNPFYDCETPERYTLALLDSQVLIFAAIWSFRRSLRFLRVFSSISSSVVTWFFAASSIRRDS